MTDEYLTSYMSHGTQQKPGVIVSEVGMDWVRTQAQDPIVCVSSGPPAHVLATPWSHVPQLTCQWRLLQSVTRCLPGVLPAI